MAAMPVVVAFDAADSGVTVGISVVVVVVMVSVSSVALPMATSASDTLSTADDIMVVVE